MKTVSTVKRLRSTKQSDDGREKGIIGSGEGSIQIPQSMCNTWFQGEKLLKNRFYSGRRQSINTSELKDL